jgi:lipopolysaccharide export system protein LptA
MPRTYLTPAVIIWLMLLCFPCLVEARNADDASTLAPDDEKSKPISITADQMEADDNQGVVVFSGSVVTRQEDMVLHCDQMRVYYIKKNNSSAGENSPVEGGVTEIDRIVAEGHVKITRGDQVAEARKAVYEANADPRTIVLTGEPRIWRERDYLTGKRIVYYLDDNRSVVEGDRDQRVNAVFYQTSETFIGLNRTTESAEESRKQP